MTKLAAWQILDQATAFRKHLLHAGMYPLPAIGKRIPVDNWTALQITETEIDSWFQRYPEARNTGVLTRTTPAVDIDVHDTDIADEIEALLWDMIGTRGLVRFGQRPKRACLFKTSAPFKKLVTPTFISASRLENRVEVLCDGQQLIVHGAHPDTGQNYSWFGGDFDKITRADLPELSQQTAQEFITRAAALMRDQGWVEDERKPNGGADAGAGGAPDDFNTLYGEREEKYAMAALVGCAHELAGMAPNSGRNDKLNKIAFRLGTMVARGWIDARQVEKTLYAAAGACGLATEDGERATLATLRSGLGDGLRAPHPDLANSGSDSWDDPDISILDDRRGELPEFPVDVLSRGCRTWVERAARGACVTAAHVAVPLLGIAGALIGTARRVQAAQSWSQPCTVWAAVVGFSGSGKTPGIDCVKRALALIERDGRSKIVDQQHANEEKIEKAKAALAAWKKQLAEAASGEVVDLNKVRAAKSAEPPPMPPEAIVPAPFVAPRLYVSDATIERLAVLLTAQPRGLLYLGDELTGLFLNMSRYSGGTDRPFWLEAWNGGGFTVERMGREPIVLAHLLIGITGGFQPDKLARTFDGDHDGIYGRVLFAWPSEPPYQPLANDVEEIEPEIVNALHRIIHLSAGTADEFAPKTIPLAPEAISTFESLRLSVRDTMHPLEGREREWLAKAQAHTLRLAGTLEFLTWAFVGGAEPAQVGLPAMQAAVALVEQYFWPHSQAALRQIGLSQRHATARRVLRWLTAGRRHDFSREDIRVQALGRTPGCAADPGADRCPGESRLVSGG